MKAPFRIKGYHVLAAMVGFFAIIIVVNAIFISLAVRSFPGEQEEKSYLQGLHYNDRLKAREAQAALGWTVNIEKASLLNEAGVIEIAFKDREGAPIYDLAVAGVLSRPADDDHDLQLEFAAAGSGKYHAQVDAIGPGVWSLKAFAANTRNETFEFETKLYFE